MGTFPLCPHIREGWRSVVGVILNVCAPMSNLKIVLILEKGCIALQKHHCFASKIIVKEKKAME